MTFTVKESEQIFASIERAGIRVTAKSLGISRQRLTVWWLDQIKKRREAQCGL